MDVITKAEKRVMDDIRQRRLRSGLPIPRRVSEVAVDRMDEKALEAIAPSTGYPLLDDIIKGFVPGHLYTFTGSENTGKTSMAVCFSVKVSQQGKRVLYFALEPENMVVDYIASARLNKPFYDLTDEDLRYDDGNILIFGKNEVPDLAQLVNIIMGMDRFDLIVIDHIGYFIKRIDNTVQEQSNAIKVLAGLAKEKKCAIMMIAHLRKRPPTQSRKKYVPSSDDISGSGAFKQDSTEVLILTRDLDPDDPAMVKYLPTGRLVVAKTKCGPNGSVDVMFSDYNANIDVVAGKGAGGIAGNIQEYREEIDAQKYVQPSGWWGGMVDRDTDE